MALYAREIGEAPGVIQIATGDDEEIVATRSEGRFAGIFGEFDETWTAKIKDETH